jgi:hypothetical protein
MNKKAQGGEILAFAIVFVVLFFIFGIIGSLSLPDFPGKFFISGMVGAIFGTGAGALVIRVIMNR